MKSDDLNYVAGLEKAIKKNMALKQLKILPSTGIPKKKRIIFSN